MLAKMQQMIYADGILDAGHLGDNGLKLPCMFSYKW